MSFPQRILILGGTGRLGGSLVEAWASRYTVLAPTRQELDLAQPQRVAEMLRGLDFDAVVNAAGLTSPDACEEQPATAKLLNVEMPAVVAEECARKGARCIHLSTDYVFSGNGCALLTEEADAQPVNVYGLTKREGEKAVLAVCPAALVGRVSWLFGPRGGDVPATVLGRARSGQPLDFIDDKWSVPTGIPDLCGWLERLITDLHSVSGLLHLCHTGVATWRDYAQVTLDLAHQHGLLEQSYVTTRRRLREFPQFKAKRPPFTVMSNERLSQCLGQSPGSWQAALERHLAMLALAEAFAQAR